MRRAMLRVVGTALLVPAVMASGFPAAAPVLASPDPHTELGQAVHEVPVLLVTGWSDVPAAAYGLRDKLLNAEWMPGRVAIVRFEDPVGSNRQHAEEVDRMVQSMLERTGADSLDIVAHSMGGLAVRHYLTFVDPSAPVRRVVFLATPHRGTMTAYLAWGEGGREMLPGSVFLTQLNRRGFPDRLRALAIQTPVDLRIIPASSAVLPEARNIEVCCPSHSGLLNDDEVFERVRGFLLAP